MSLTKPVNKLFKHIDEAYFHFKGFYQGAEVRIEGVEGTISNDHTTLWVRVYWNGHLMTYYCSPFNTMRTARKYAKEMAASVARNAAVGRQSGWSHRADYCAHVTTRKKARVGMEDDNFQWEAA